MGDFEPRVDVGVDKDGWVFPKMSTDSSPTSYPPGGSNHSCWIPHKRQKSTGRNVILEGQIRCIVAFIESPMI